MSAGDGVSFTSRLDQQSDELRQSGKVISAAFMDAFNQMVISLRNYRAQTVQGQGLGGGGKLGVDGGATPQPTYTPQNAPRGRKQR